MGDSVPENTVFLLVSIFLVAPLVTGIFAPSVNGQEFDGSLETDIYLDPSDSTDLIISGEPLATLNLSYSTGGFSYSSESVFYRDELYSQEFGTDYRLGIFDLGSTLSFEPQETRMNYWLSEGSFALAGAWFDTTFLLQYSENREEYGAGLEVGISGNLTDEVSADLTTRFGMEENEAEQLGLESGSGYTVVTSHGDDEDVYGASELQYFNSEFQFTGLAFDCCEYDVTTEFSEAKGFEKTEFEFTIGTEEEPVRFDVDLTFTGQTKSVVLDPSLVTDWGCFDVYTTLTTDSSENKLGTDSVNADTLTGLKFKGFGLSDVSLGHVTFSSLTALDGNLYKLKGTYNMDLRTDDYILEPPQEYINRYDETDYDQVFSLYKSGQNLNLTFGGDFYFDMAGDETEARSVFDTALVTGDGRYKVSDQFSVGAGFAIKPNHLETLRFSFDYSF